MHTLVLIRHGQSTWNLENRFTGWTDVDLTEKGRAEAQAGGRELAAEGLDFDLCHTSLLTRAIRTLWIVQEELERLWLPVQKTWRLNERHYGALQGLNKAETAEKYGDEQVFVWRRSFDIPPPSLEKNDSRWPGNDRRYSHIAKGDLPRGESLQLTIERTMPYWHDVMAPQIQRGKRLLVVAHGNSLRGLVKYLDKMDDEEITKLNIPTGVPLVYTLDDNLNAQSKRYLMDPEALAKAEQEVANQAKST